MRATADNPPSPGEVIAQIRRARARIADLESRSIAAGEYDHAAALRRAGEALDDVVAAAERARIDATGGASP